MALFGNHNEILEAVEESQSSDQDERDESRADEHFIHKKDGQWEPNVSAVMRGRPKYTFDECETYINQITGELDQFEFSISVSPNNENADSDTAEIFDGLIRNTEQQSGARNIYSYSAREALESALSGWRIVSEYCNDDSFYKDLKIKQIWNYKDRVFFDPSAKMRTQEDADFCFILTELSRKKYKELYPKGSGISVGESRRMQVYTNREDGVIIGEGIYKQKAQRELVLMNNGSVYPVDDDFNRVADELLRMGISEIAREKRDITEIYQRYFDGGDFLGDELKLIYSYIPIIPVFCNFKVSENKIIYRSAINKLKDAQRVINYAASRDVEEGALAPRAKIAMTPEQIAGHQDELKTINVDANPILTYNQVDGHTPPYKLQGPEVNTGLLATKQSMKDHMLSISGQFAANQGDNPGLQSGVAITKQISKGNNASFKYFKMMEIPIQHTGKILVSTYPKIYDSKRVARILNKDGTNEFVTIRDIVVDEQTGQHVEINNLSKGSYSTTCSVGDAFQSQQQETVERLIDYAKIDPTIMQDGSDILLRNINSPGMKELAERRRLKMVMSGVIPEKQLTDEEKELIMKLQQQGQQLSPQDQLALSLAEAEVAKAEAQTSDTLSKIQERIAKTELEILKIRQKNDEIAVKGNSDQQRINIQLQQLIANLQQTEENVIKTQAETLKIIKEAMGIDAALNKNALQAYDDQAVRLDGSQ